MGLGLLCEKPERKESPTGLPRSSSYLDLKSPSKRFLLNVKRRCGFWGSGLLGFEASGSWQWFRRRKPWGGLGAGGLREEPLNGSLKEPL